MIKEFLKYGLCFVVGVCLSSAIHMFMSRSLTLKQKPQKKVAIIIKTMKTYEEIATGLLSGLAKEQKVNFASTIYATDAKDPITTASFIEKALDADPDLVFVVGETLAQSAKSIIDKRSLQTPIVFVAVADPITMGLVQDLERPGYNVTGTNSTAEDITEQIRLFLKVAPQVKRILLPYAIADGEASVLSAEAVKVYAEAQGLEVTILPIEADQSGLFMIQGLIHNVDAVMYLPISSLCSIADGIVKICKQHGVIVFSPELFRAMCGDAPFAFGLWPKQLGKAAAVQVRQILVNGLSASTMPIQVMSRNKKFFVNLDVIEEQNILVDKDLLRLMSCGNLIKNQEKW